MIKKSTFTSLIVVLVIVIAISSFFAGSYITNLTSDKITKSDLDTAISKLESKIEGTIVSIEDNNGILQDIYTDGLPCSK